MSMRILNQLVAAMLGRMSMVNEYSRTKYYNGGEKPHKTRKGSGRSGHQGFKQNQSGIKLLREFKSKQGGLRHKRKLGWEVGK